MRGNCHFERSAAGAGRSEKRSRAQSRNLSKNAVIAVFCAGDECKGIFVTEISPRVALGFRQSRKRCARFRHCKQVKASRTYCRREKTEHRAAGNAANVGFSLKSSESQHLFCEIRAKDKIITRASRVAPLRQRTQIANTFAFAGKVSRGILIICVPFIMPRRGKLRLTRAKRGQWGCPENHDFLFCQLKTKSVNGNNFSQKRKSQFSFLPPICRKAYAERVNLRA